MFYSNYSILKLSKYYKNKIFIIIIFTIILTIFQLILEIKWNLIQ